VLAAIHYVGEQVKRVADRMDALPAQAPLQGQACQDETVPEDLFAEMAPVLERVRARHREAERRKVCHRASMHIITVKCQATSVRQCGP
jgi:hypothetical protein